MICKLCKPDAGGNITLIEKVVRQKETGFDPMAVLANAVGDKNHDVLLRFNYCPDCHLVYFNE